MGQFSVEKPGLPGSVLSGNQHSIVYRAQLEAVRGLTGFLVKDCCGWRPELCAPLIADLTPCCPPQKPSSKEVAHG
jgi:ArsR family transcriptional regulator